MRSGIDANFLSTNEDSEIRSTVDGPSGEGTHLIFAGIQI